MTTLAIKDGIMCSDSQITSGETITSTETVKLFKIGTDIVGVGGSVCDSRVFVEYLEGLHLATDVRKEYPSASIGDPDKPSNTDMQALVLSEDGSITAYYGFDYFNVTGTMYAMGSGRDFALAAMDAGLSAEESVQIAIKRDVYSGGDVQVMKLEEK